jgi:hypothetical protein
MRRDGGCGRSNRRYESVFIVVVIEPGMAGFFCGFASLLGGFASGLTRFARTF